MAAERERDRWKAMDIEMITGGGGAIANGSGHGGWKQVPVYDGWLFKNLEFDANI